MVRDVKRIEGFLRELKYHWEAMPDLRLGQLIMDAHNGKDPFYVEDDVLMEEIRDFHEKSVDGQSGEGPVYDGG